MMPSTTTLQKFEMAPFTEDDTDLIVPVLWGGGRDLHVTTSKCADLQFGVRALHCLSVA